MPTTFKDYYSILGVPRTATEKDVRTAFRKLARQHHPDIKPGDKAAEARFKEINEANEVLSDPAKRSKYNQLGPNWEAFSNAGTSQPGARARQSGANAGGVRYEFRGGDAGGGFSDFFRTFFGAAAGGEAQSSPA